MTFKRASAPKSKSNTKHAIPGTHSYMRKSFPSNSRPKHKQRLGRCTKSENKTKILLHKIGRSYNNLTNTLLIFCYFGVDLELDTDLKSVKRKENTNLILYGFQFLMMLCLCFATRFFVIRGIYPLMSDVAVFVMFCVWTVDQILFKI